MKKKHKLPDIVGERLKELRNEKGYTQQQVANFLLGGVAVKTYREWEQGTRKPSTEALLALSGLYNVSVDYLLGVSDYKTINGQMVHKITGLSDSAIDTLQRADGGRSSDQHYSDNDPAWRNTLRHPIADTVSELLDDYSTNGDNSILVLLRKYQGTDPALTVSISSTGRIVPANGSHIAQKSAVSFNVSENILEQIKRAVMSLRDKKK